MKYIAFITKGLGEIIASELKDKLKVENPEVSDKFVFFDYEDEIPELKKLLTIDDVAFLLSDKEHSQMLYEDVIANLDLESIKSSIETLKSFRKLRNDFSVTVSKFRNGVIDAEILKLKVAKVIERELGLTYAPKDHTNIDIRINIEHNRLIQTIKVFPQSLFRREYNHRTVMGGLRASIAGAMVYKVLAGRTGLKLVDNLCGSGTILAEAHMQGCEVYGGDIKERNVDLTKENLAKLDANVNRIVKLDAMTTPWHDNDFDLAVSNFPWDKQIEVNNLDRLYRDAIAEYARILKPDASIAFIGVRPKVMTNYLRENFPDHEITEFQIGFQGQMPSVVFVMPK